MLERMSGPDYIVDIDGLRRPQEQPAPPLARGRRGRPWLAIRWRCCSAYSRIYRNAQQSAYEGRCPRCGRLLKVPIGPDGTSERFFDAE